MVDPGFLRWGRQPLSLSQKPIILQDFSRKVHKNERNQTEGGRPMIVHMHKHNPKKIVCYLMLIKLFWPLGFLDFIAFWTIVGKERVVIRAESNLHVCSLFRFNNDHGRPGKLLMVGTNQKTSFKKTMSRKVVTQIYQFQRILLSLTTSSLASPSIINFP